MTSNNIYIPRFTCVVNLKKNTTVTVSSTDTLLHLLNDHIFKTAKIKFKSITAAVIEKLKHLDNTTVSHKLIKPLLVVENNINKVLVFRGYSESEILLARKEIARNMYDVKTVMDTKNLTEEEAKLWIKNYLAKNITPRNKEYWIKEGFSESDAIEKVKENQSNSGKLYGIRYKENPDKYNGRSTTHLQYYMNKGFTKEEAEIELTKRQTTFSLDVLLQKMNYFSALERWQTRQDKWATIIKQ